jgi:hypothetical protein
VRAPEPAELAEGGVRNHKVGAPVFAGIGAGLLVLILGGAAAWQAGLFDQSEAISRLSGNASSPGEVAAWMAGYTDEFLSDTETRVLSAEAELRDYPSSDGTRVLRSLPEGASVMGRLVRGRPADQMWFRLDEGGYIWGGNIAGLAPIGLSDSVKADEGLAGGEVYDDPFAYCAAVGTIDEPGPGYAGAEIPTAVSSAVGTDMVAWRCEQGRVLACTTGASGRACAQKDRSTTPQKSLIAFCRLRPNQDPDMATIGNSAWAWRCRGRDPEPLNVNQNALDGRGYYKDTWEVVPDPGGGRGSTPYQTAGEDAPTINIAGNWYDGGPGCASVKTGQGTRTITLNAWYCEADKSSSVPVYLDFDRTVNAYVHELTGLQVKIISGQKIQIISSSEIRNRLGDDVYLAENVRDYFRQ